jgi:hypothetical protein
MDFAVEPAYGQADGGGQKDDPFLFGVAGMREV